MVAEMLMTLQSRTPSLYADSLKTALTSAMLMASWVSKLVLGKKKEKKKKRERLSKARPATTGVQPNACNITSTSCLLQTTSRGTLSSSRWVTISSAAASREAA